MNDYPAFPARFVADPAEGFPHMTTVIIPGLDGTEDGAYTSGYTLEEAREMAVDLVDTWLIFRDENEQPWPRPARCEGTLEEGWELVRPSLRVYWALTLRRLRKRLDISQGEAARRLGVSQPVYARLEDPRKSNPTLKTLDRIGKAFEVELQLSVA